MGLFNSDQAKVIYISYIPDDIYYASTVAENLRDAGYNVVTTPYQMETKLKTLCAQITESADAIVSIASPGATRSERFWADIATARMNGTPVLPLVVHDFANGAPMKHYISATDSIEQGCDRLQASLKRAGAYRDNFIGHRPPVLKRMTRTIFAAATVAVFSIISLLFR